MKRDYLKNPHDPYQRKQFKKTCLEKYGVENIFQLNSIKEKSKITRKQKYTPIS